MKLRKISEITATLPFSEFDFMQKYRESFAVSELGRIHAQLLLKELAEKIRSHFPKTHPQGNTPMFPPEGEVALMFLKPYTGQDGERIAFRTPNYTKILNTMRTQPTLTLADMKDETGISITAIQKLLDQLISKKYVERGEKEGSWRVFLTQ